MSEPIVRPDTGEIVPDDLAVMVELEAATDAALRGLWPQYELRRRLRERIAELQGPPELPPPRYRTPVQERVAACPRCGRKLEDSVEAPAGTVE